MVSAGTLIWLSLRPLLRLSVVFIVQLASSFKHPDLYVLDAVLRSRRPVCSLRLQPVVLVKSFWYVPLLHQGSSYHLAPQNIATPCLLFSKIVPAFTAQNINALGMLSLVQYQSIDTSRLQGPLVLIGIIYLGLGVFMAWIISQLFWVPHRFRFGILMAGGWVNYGDIRK